MDAPAKTFMVGRQPIFDVQREVRGYELLFRGPDGVKGDAMTADVLVHAALDVGLTQLVGNKLAFVNTTRPFLVGEQSVPLPPEQTVIEVLETVNRDAEALAGCKRLVEKGYTLALDDFDWASPDDPLLGVVSMVKLDVLTLPKVALIAQAARFSNAQVELVAKRVETPEQFELCRELGFSLFQGYLLSRPEVVRGQTLTPGKVTSLRLMNELCDPAVEAEDIQRIVETDAALTYRFLRLAGEGASRGLYRPVRSVREGVVLLGLQKLRAWVMLMLLSGAEGISSEQLHIAMTRARMAELLGAEAQAGLGDPAFTVGLVSALELLLGAPMPEILDKLVLADDIAGAVLDHAGILGRILDDVLSWEFGGFGLDVQSGLPLADMERAYIEALSWANEACSLIEPAVVGAGA
jgi:c-di-GMP-related signal transduction protein